MMVWMFVFAMCIMLLFALPMMPAINEWRHKRDAKPLRVVREHDGKVTHFAAGFQRFLKENLPASRSAAQVTDAVLANGSSCQFVGGQGVPSFTPAEAAAKSTRKLFIGDVPLVLPTGYFFEAEMYAAQGIESGSWNTIRALLSDGSVQLGEGTDIIRWAHATNTIEFGHGSRLYGRISSDTAICLHQKTLFGRMHAPVIRFGAQALTEAPGFVAEPELRPWKMQSRVLTQGAGRTLLLGDLDLPESIRHDGSLVVRGRLKVGRASLINGSIKTSRRLALARGVRVSGAVVSAQDMLMEPDCRVAGPVVAERRLVLKSGCVIGTPTHPTTITADEVLIEEGVTVHGTIWPRKEGRVVRPGGIRLI